MTSSIDSAQQRFNALPIQDRVTVLSALNSLPLRRGALTPQEMQEAFNSTGHLAELTQDCYAALLLGKFQVN